MSGIAFDKNLKSFLNHIASIRDTLPMVMLLLQPYNKKANDDFVEFLKNNVEEIEEDDGEKKLLVKSEEAGIFDTLEKNATISSLAEKIIPTSLFVSLISNYDAFFNGLLRVIFQVKPEVLNTSEKNLAFSQLVDMEKIENAREYIIEKEIDSVIRKSHSEQFDYLEKLLSMNLRENLPIWKTFIEITERRNLFVHCGLIIKDQPPRPFLLLPQAFANSDNHCHIPHQEQTCYLVGILLVLIYPTSSPNAIRYQYECQKYCKALFATGERILVALISVLSAFHQG